MHFVRLTIVAATALLLCSCAVPPEPLPSEDAEAPGAPEAAPPPEVAAPPAVVRVTASSQQGSEDWSRPENAADGDPATRWSSAFTDEEWIRFEFAKEERLAGAILRWEDAYGQAYDIETSADGEAWQTVYSTDTGDGDIDYVFFEPRAARFARISGRERGTGFGYSLWEVEWLGGAEALVLSASSALPGAGPENLLRLGKGGWHSEPADEASVEIDLRRPVALGSLTLTWGADHPRELEVEVSEDGASWRTAYADDDVRGGTTRAYFEEAPARRLRIRCARSSTGQGFALERLDLGGAGSALTVRKFFELAAERAPDCYPRWLSREQAFWTAVGVPDDDKESIFCEDGTIEHHKRGFTLMPLLYADGRLLTRDDAVVTQSLQNNHLPIPSVHWQCDDLNMDITTFAYGADGASSVYTRYAIVNRGEETRTGRLFLLVRPFQLYPPWQGGGEGENEEEGKGLGGLARIHSIRRTDEGLGINAKYSIGLPSPPDAYGAEAGLPPLTPPYRDVLIDDLRSGALPGGDDAEDPDGLASAVLAYDFDLAPGAAREVFVAMPLHARRPVLTGEMAPDELHARFEDMRRRAASRWKRLVSVVDLAIPEPDLVDTIKANLAYTFITKDGPSLQPGSWCYDKSWIRDGSVAAVALLRFGYTNEARAFIDWYTAHQYDSGEIPCVIDNKAANPFWEGISEYDSQGEFVWMVYQYYRFTGDRDFLAGKFTNVVRALQFAESLRNRRTTPEYRDDPSKRLLYGLISKSYANHNYFDNLWTLKGWRDGMAIARALGREEAARWMAAQYEALRASVYTSMTGAMAAHGIDYIPEYPEGTHFWAASIAAAVSHCDETANMPQPQLGNTFEKYYQQLRAWQEPGAEYRFTPEEMPIVEVFLKLGWKERAVEFLRFMMAHRKPPGWKQWPEVVNSDERLPTIFGDQPHTWVSAQFISAVTSLLAYEDGDRLVVGAGIPPDWAAAPGVKVEGLCTHFGRLGFTLQAEGSHVTVRFTGDLRPPEGILLRSPLPAPLRAVIVDGEPWQDFAEDEVRFEELPRECVLIYE